VPFVLAAENLEFGLFNPRLEIIDDIFPHVAATSRTPGLRREEEGCVWKTHGIVPLQDCAGWISDPHDFKTFW
jgi:hypothetical protein